LSSARRAAVALLCAWVLTGAGPAATASVAAAQASRIATTADVLIASAVFFHGRSVVVQQKLVTDGDVTRLAETPKPVYVFWKDRPSRDEGEIRGEFWDLGRIESRDGRFAGYDFAHLIETVNRGQWPGRDQIFVLLGATLQPSPPPTPSVRTIALAPDSYLDRDVKVIGRFKGSNLYGDLPLALGKDKWDFVLQSADGALWVTGVRPRGKGFDLDPSKRVDTGRWVEVTGVVRRQGATPYIEASAIGLATAPEDAPVAVMLPEQPPQPAPEVIFSAPVQDDHDIERRAPVRIQFSRDMDPATIKDRVVVTYVSPPGEAAALAAPPFTATYNDAAHAIEITFSQPLERFRQVRIELREGITALDGQILKPWALTFTTGR
jgi:hypothetical protein